MLDWKRVIGSPGVTREDVMASMDLAALARGEDVAYFYPPFHFPFLFIDEINRFSEPDQNIMREGIANGIWNYGAHTLRLDRQVVIAAINLEEYGGVFHFNENLVDNFALVLWPPIYEEMGWQAEVMQDAEGKIKEKLGLEKVVHEFQDFYLKNKEDATALAQRLEGIQKQTLKEFEKRGVPAIFNGQFDEIRKQVNEIPISAEALLFRYSLLAETNRSRKYGRNTVTHPSSDSSHDLPYLSTKLRESIEGRAKKDGDAVARALTWYQGKKEVGIEEIRAAFIYSLPRRLLPEESFRQEVLNASSELPLRHAIAKKVADIAFEHYTDFKSNGNNKAFSTVRKVIKNIAGKTSPTDNEIYKHISVLEAVDHPIAADLIAAIVQERIRKKI